VSRLTRHTAVLVLAVAVLGGCKNDLPKATEIVHMRVLGATLEVVGDETRSTPKPGETVSISMTTVFPLQKENTDSAQSMLIFCTAPNRFTGGLPVCQEFLDAAQSGSGTDITAALPLASGKVHCSDLPEPILSFGGVSVQCISGDPAAQFKVAENFAAKQKLLIGVICERGDAFINPNDPLIFGCDHDSGETLRVNELITVEQNKSDENHNPSAANLGVALETRSKDAWSPIDPGLVPVENNCGSLAGGDALPQVDYLSHTMTLSYTAAARETLNGEPEDLELSVYATGGSLERRFTLFSASDPVTKGQLQSDLTWDPPLPAELPMQGRQGKLIRFFVTVRDHRGGFASTSRAVCIKVGS
jgi:hypothetical protein